MLATAGKVMITTGAADDEAYKTGNTSLFQLYTPGSLYMSSTVDMLKELDPEAKIALVYEAAKFGISHLGAGPESGRNTVAATRRPHWNYPVVLTSIRQYSCLGLCYVTISVLYAKTNGTTDPFTIFKQVYH